uniref:CSON012289 protein n=1 Tax=Culicoides sonorensis TaxID=179676 RepID=A0A336LN08_CULSO
MLDEKIDQLVQMLEKQEMEATNISVTIYTELLAAYLYQGDLNNANYLWKRIPVSIKQGNRELERLQKIYRHLIDNDYPAFYRALDFDWSRNIAEIIETRVLEYNQ